MTQVNSDSSSDEEGRIRRRGGLKRCKPKRAVQPVWEFEEGELAQRIESHCYLILSSVGDSLLSWSEMRRCASGLERSITMNLKPNDNGRYDEELVLETTKQHVQSVKTEQFLSSSHTRASTFTEISSRSSNEDRSMTVYDIAPNVLYAAVFDGHSGTEAATACQYLFHHVLSEAPGFPLDIRKAFKHSFKKMQSLLLARADWSNSESGSTATCAIIRSGRLLVANVGDSSAVLCRKEKALVLTGYHHISNIEERRAVENRGAVIVNMYGAPMINGRISVTRTLGFKGCHEVLSHDPDIYETELTRDDEFLIIASDGLWDVITPPEAVHIVRVLQHKEVDEDVLTDVDSIRSTEESYSEHNIAEILVSEARARGSGDNITVTILDSLSGG